MRHLILFAALVTLAACDPTGTSDDVFTLSDTSGSPLSVLLGESFSINAQVHCDDTQSICASEVRLTWPSGDGAYCAAPTKELAEEDFAGSDPATATTSMDCECVTEGTYTYAITLIDVGENTTAGTAEGTVECVGTADISDILALAPTYQDTVVLVTPPEQDNVTVALEGTWLRGSFVGDVVRLFGYDVDSNVAVKESTDAGLTWVDRADLAVLGEMWDVAAVSETATLVTSQTASFYVDATEITPVVTVDWVGDVSATRSHGCFISTGTGGAFSTWHSETCAPPYIEAASTMDLKNIVDIEGLAIAEDFWGGGVVEKTTGSDTWIAAAGLPPAASPQALLSWGEALYAVYATEVYRREVDTDWVTWDSSLPSLSIGSQYYPTAVFGFGASGVSRSTDLIDWEPLAEGGFATVISR